MTAEEVLSTLRSLGVQVHAAGDRLRLKPASAIPHDLRNAVTAHKQELLALLARGEHQALLGEAAATFPSSRIEEYERWRRFLRLACKTWPREPLTVVLWRASRALAEVLNHLIAVGDAVGEARARYAWECLEELAERLRAGAVEEAA